MAACRGSSSRWFFTREQLENTPSRRCGIEPDRELSYRQQAANLIQDMGQRLNVSQLTINTAIVYMHRFYMYHSFTKFHRNIISPTTLFLAAKVEEQPRKLEYVIKVAHACLNPQEPQLDIKSNAYLQRAQELAILETIVLQSLGFEITIEHPHTDVVKCSQLVRASKDLAQTSYFMATNSLHLTTFCLQYKPTVIACVCIHLACKWSNWEIPVSTDGKHWWEYVDPSVTLELLDELTHEFLQILEKTPNRLKRIRNWRANQAAKRPKAEGQVTDNTFPGSSLVQNQSLVDNLTGLSGNAAFPKPPSSTSFPVTLPSTSGGVSLDSVNVVATTIQSTSYNFTAPNDCAQHQDQSRSDMYSVKHEILNLQQGTSGQLHPAALHHRQDKCTDYSSNKHEHKSSSSKHHVLLAPSHNPTPQKMTLDKYKEKHTAEFALHKCKVENLELENQTSFTVAAQGMGDQQHHKKHQLQQISSSVMTSPIKVKIPIANAEKTEKHSLDKKDKASLLKLRIPILPAEKSSKEELKMKIKVSSERHSSSDEGSGKSKHSSPLIGKEHKEKHREHSSHRHHSGSHKHSLLHSHSHSGNSSTSKLNTDGTVTAALKSPVGLGSDGGTSSSSSSRKRSHADVSHNHHSKMSKSSKSSGSSSNSSSVKQYVSSHNSILNLPFPPPHPVTYQVGCGHLSTLVKLDKKPVETNSPDDNHEFSANRQHMDYKDTFDMLDSLLSAQGMNM
ncbi:cyclin-T2a isoform X1 [Polypterus senegalus]|uniref:cyclin-T2a isoform X1 n=1 Tax=Polypterus senegalus TaxID=55291 RepID=UPI0019635D9C|nr:cyclin-T2a isoform X1 [Polypterus senegalus]